MTGAGPKATEQPTGPQRRLRFSSDQERGIRRRRVGRGFRYLAADDGPIRDPSTLARIRALAIPPAWDEVWICPDDLGHVQAVGRDARGRKQYRYHQQWRAEHESSKYARVATFGRALPAIRRRVARDMSRPGLPKEKVLATVVDLLEVTNLRIGNDEYARINRSFGLTTLRNRHATVDGSSLRFRFRGKGGRLHEVGVRDRRLARIVSACQDLPGQELFQYLDERGEPLPIGSTDVNEYLRIAARAEVSAKDFRTWAGTLLAFRALRSSVEPAGPEARGSVGRATELVAEALGNTPTVSRQSYIAPVVIDAYVAGRLRRGRTPTGARQPGLETDRREELALIHLIEAASRSRR
jgi:DNA topoisomerase-1